MDSDQAEHQLLTYVMSDAICDVLRRSRKFQLSEREILLSALESYVACIHPNDRATGYNLIEAIKKVNI